MIALMPHGSCFLWDPWLTSLHVVSDTLVAIAYLSIPVLLFKNRHHVVEPVRPIVLLFSAFILSCGIGHMLRVWNVWHADYWLEGSWTWLTGTISLYTAWQLRRLIPQLLATQEALEANRTLARHDPLTGLANRRGLMAAIAALPTHTGSQVLKHTLMLIDLDGFKAINDTYGHATGDTLLKALNPLLSQKIRSIDLAVRLGGDEFALLLVGCSPHEARPLAESLRQDIQNLRLPHLPSVPNQPLVSASIGVTELWADGNLDKSYQQADAALYAAKHNGKNQIVIAPDPASTDGNQRSTVSLPEGAEVASLQSSSC